MSKKSKKDNTRIIDTLNDEEKSPYEEVKDLLYLTDTVLKGVAASIDEIATHVLDNAKILQDNNEVHLSLLEKFSTEMAWVLYASVALSKPNMDPVSATVFADTILKEQKKRFEPKKETLCVPTCQKSSSSVSA